MNPINNKTSILITDANAHSKKSIPVLTLEDAVEIISVRLKETRNIKKLAIANNLCYRNVLDIKKRKDTRYPLLVKSLLKLLLDIEVEISQIYILK